MNSIENDARIAEARVEATNDSLDRLKKQIGGASSQDVQLRALEREAKAQRDLLESYLARYREAAARENIDSSLAEARIISRATVSNVPAFPKKLPILLIAMLATAFLMAAFVLSSEILQAGRPARSASPALVPFERAEPAAADRCRVASGAALDLLGAEAKARRRRAATRAANRSNCRTGRVRMPARGRSGIRARAASRPRSTILRRLCSNSAMPAGVITVVGAARNVGTTHTALTLARALAAKGGQGGAVRSRAQRAQSVDPVDRSAGAGLCRTRARHRFIR